ncbi:PQQ-like beta-propeller repeat protein [Puniceicoccales bacterium CK1056]|uniref:PQQ-like beta-propeller repeat protein n=1 Tax=Oceanipulchritudo coccoides TaxID=2706888 RepID=A0A6B2M0W3_9BACT|nr:PQQ-binding-like beta-propeller repeat protein [Oceanipulchritudo coccoides]NDV62042.1 PQQ-like beta-propeller repeat protein [Oceanipulchritudo coccoides]
MKAILTLPVSVCLLASIVTISPTEGAYGDLIWKAETGNTVYAAPAIGPDGTVVVGSEDTNVYSYNPDGSLRWIFTDPTDWVDSSPTIAPDGTVYVGSWDNFLYAINGKNGSLIWKFETGGLIIASPAISPDGTIYLASNDSFLYAVNPDGTQKWVSEAVDSYSPINSSPVLNQEGDTLYFGNEEGELFALDAISGSKRWSFAVPNDPLIPDDEKEVAIVGSPAIGSGGDIYFGSEDGSLYALNSSGALRWSFETIETIRSSPAIAADGTVYFAAQDGYLYALDSEGFQLWETFVGDVFYCSPAIDADGNILICGYDGSSVLGPASLFTSVSADGQIIWEYLIVNFNDSSPNIAPDGSIYFGAHDGALYKFEGSARLMDGQWPRFQSNRRQSGFLPDLENTEMVDVFPAITQVVDDWILVPWFGSGWLKNTGLPWVEHQEHGLLWIESSTVSDVIYYEFNGADWLYASDRAPDYYYRYSSSSWFFHVQGSAIYTGRYFFDPALSEWTGPGL